MSEIMTNVEIETPIEAASKVDVRGIPSFEIMEMLDQALEELQAVSPYAPEYQQVLEEAQGYAKLALDKSENILTYLEHLQEDASALEARARYHKEQAQEYMKKAEVLSNRERRLKTDVLVPMMETMGKVDRNGKSFIQVGLKKLREVGQAAQIEWAEGWCAARLPKEFREESINYTAKKAELIAEIERLKDLAEDPDTPRELRHEANHILNDQFSGVTVVRKTYGRLY